VKNYEARRHHQQPKKTLPLVKLPSFNGDNDSNVYLGWKVKVEQIFNMYEVKEDQKVKLSSLEFEDYAMQWWHQTIMNIRLNKRPTMISWHDLKLCMRPRFVPPHYRKKLLMKLQWLHQGPRIVDEYFKDLEVTLTKINMHESKESKITRFVSGLRREIQNVVELYEYTSLDKLVHLAIKVQSQLLRKTFSNIFIMMTFTTHLGRIKINFTIKIFLPIPLKNPPHKLLKTTFPLLELNRQPKPQIKNVSNV